MMLIPRWAVDMVTGADAATTIAQPDTTSEPPPAAERPRQVGKSCHPIVDDEAGRRVVLFPAAPDEHRRRLPDAEQAAEFVAWMRVEWPGWMLAAHLRAAQEHWADEANVLLAPEPRLSRLVKGSPGVHHVQLREGSPMVDADLGRLIRAIGHTRPRAYYFECEEEMAGRLPCRLRAALSVPARPSQEGAQLRLPLPVARVRKAA